MEWQIVSYFELKDREKESFLEFLSNIEWRGKNSLRRKIVGGFFKENQNVFILKNKNDWIGFIALVMEDEGIILDAPFLAYLYISLDYRKKGFPKVLLEYCNKQIEKLGFDKSYILSDHIGYYERFGYQKIQKLENGDSLFVLSFEKRD